jgi:single-stranded DNA-binding protein
MIENLNNQTQLIGRVTEDAVVRRISQGGNQVISFSIAVNGGYKSKGVWLNTVEYFEVEKWIEASKEIKIDKLFTKGTLFAFKGKAISKAYLDKNNKIVQKLGLSLDTFSLLSQPKQA